MAQDEYMTLFMFIEENWMRFVQSCGNEEHAEEIINKLEKLSQE